MKLHLVTYGCGDRYERKKFNPIENREHMKPAGGLWASPINSKYGWRAWCQDNDYGDLSSHFIFSYDGKILKIDRLEDVDKLPWYTLYDGHLHCIDYEAARNGVDAIWLTERGVEEIMFSYLNLKSLYGWECECVLIMNPRGIVPDSHPKRRARYTRAVNQTCG